MTSFEQKIMRLLRRIPRGKVATYRELARAAGKPRAARAVGNALNKNPYPYGVAGLPAGRQAPCHRVVLADGRLGGYAHGAERKALLLEKEGVGVDRGRVDLKRYGYEFRK